MVNLEELIVKYHRIGALDRAKWLENIDQKIPPSFKERIKQNDKSVLRELILPSWVEWDLLRAWALEESEGEKCDFCGKESENFVVYKDHIICKDCLSEIKKL